MALQVLEFVDQNLAITGMMAMPVPPTPGVQYGFEADPNTGLFVPVASTLSGGAPAQEFIIGGRQWNILSHTLGTDRVQAIISLASAMEYSSSDGSATGAYYPKYEPVGHGVVQGTESSNYLIDLGPNYPPADSIYVLLFAVGTDSTAAGTSTTGTSTSTGTTASTGTLTLAVTPQPARTGTTYTINLKGASPGEAVTVNWETTPSGPSSYTYTANNQGQIVDTDVVGSAGSPVGNYSGTISSTSGKTGNFTYTLG